MKLADERGKPLPCLTERGGDIYQSMRSFLIGKGGSMLRSPDLIEQWRLTQQEYLTDTPTVMAHQALDQRRLHMQQEMAQLLDDA